MSRNQSIFQLDSTLQKTKVKISVLLPVRNGGDQLAAGLRVILHSILETDEILVIDDNSTDGSINSAQKHFLMKQIRIIPNQGTGLVDALNTGIRESVNPWLARFDVGDFYNVERLQIQRAIISSKTVAVFSDYLIEDSSGNGLGYIPTSLSSPAVKLSLLKSQRTPHPSALLRKSAVVKAGGYKADEYPAEDLGLWLRLSQLGELNTVPYPLLIYRLSTKSITGQNYMRAKQASHYLVREHSGYVKAVEDICLEAFLKRREILQCYRQFPKKRERQLLFLLDFLYASTLKRVKKSMRLKMLVFSIFKLLNPLLTIHFSHLVFDRNKRHKWRDRQ